MTVAKRETVGVSQKVSWPAVALAGLSIIAFALAAVLKEDTLISVGAALLAASGITGAVGYRAPAAAVRHVPVDKP